MSAPALTLRAIVKRFGPVTALDGASLTVARGTVHALLGENGAGKTTLMRIAYGLDRPDAGLIELGGKSVRLRAPSDAIDHGLGMVQQHFSLVPAMTVTENIELGRRGPYRPREASGRVRMLSLQTSLHIDPDAHAADLPPASQQKLELLKIFSREARTLILDEPTAVLAPAETEELMRLVRRVANEGGAVVLVTHKLREALAVADEVTVLRRGRTVLTAPTHTLDEAALARAMFSDDVVSETFGTPEAWVFQPNFLRDGNDRGLFLEIVFGSARPVEEAIPFELVEKHVRPTDYESIGTRDDRTLYPFIPRTMSEELPSLEGGIPDGFHGVGEVRFLLDGDEGKSVPVEFVVPR